MANAQDALDALYGKRITLGDLKMLLAADMQARHSDIHVARTEYTQTINAIMREGERWALLDNSIVRYDASERVIRHQAH